MPIDTVPDFLSALRTTQLLDGPQLAEVEQTLAPRLPEPRGLARELLQRGWLTPFQVNQVFQGRAADLVLGQYVLIERLGEGGMGQVFKARHRLMNRTVALKLIRNEIIAHPQTVRRFRQEIQAAAQLSHPNIVLAHDADEVDGKHFLTMEYVDGADLAKLVKQHGPLPADRACDYVRQAALGLQHAHERGLIHRDIKPSNLMLVSGGVVSGEKHPPHHSPLTTHQVKVLDLGLARLQGDDPAMTPTHELTKTGSVVGTADYMAPEQAVDSHKADVRADIYSLGCTLYFLLTGQPPFPGGTVMQKIFSHNQEEPQAVELLRADLSDGIVAVLRRMMAKRPEDRYQTATATAAALTPFCQPGQSATLKVAADKPAHSLQPASMLAFATLAVPEDQLRIGARSSMLDVQHRPRRGIPWFIGVAGAAALLIVVGVAIWALTLRSGHASGPAAATTPSTMPLAQVYTNSLGMKMVLIPAGKFTMGSPADEKLRNPAETPQHEVTISKPFYMDAHEVTVGQFRAFVRDSNYVTDSERSKAGAIGLLPGKSGFRRDPQITWENPGWRQEDNYPVTCVTWNDARAFCAWLSQKEGRTYRLPTEAEWEYACRANTTTPFSFGPALTSFQANFHGAHPYGDEVRGPNLQRPAKVGAYKPNAFGLHDMHGNVTEWVADFYKDGYPRTPQTDPVGPEDPQEPNLRVMRGGSWFDEGQLCRSAMRGSMHADNGLCVIGFRVVYTP